jgi:hypothetical protein
MAAIIGLAVLCLVIQVLLLAVAAVIGFGLCWCIPDMNIGNGILIGLISSIASIYFTVQLVKLGYIGALEDALNDQDDKNEDDPDVRLVLSPASKNRRQRSKKK